jgi:serine/threonine protein kinase
MRLATYGEPVEGTPFGRYRLIELLGHGGMGEVWRAHDTSTNRIVAIKLLPAHLAEDDTFVKRFRREAEEAARLNNPHIIPIHNYGEIDGRLYVDMRLIEGRDLQQVLADGPIDPARAVRIIEGVAKALHAAHEVGLVHRDVKPSNILLDRDDFAYLIDFGIARATEDTKLTGTGSIIGSWPYMSPERLRAGQVDARADIYALACVLYECLTGSTPYPGDNFEQQMTAHLTEPPPRPSSTDPNIPKQVDQVIATGMAKDPDQRYATTVELASAAHDAITTPLPQPSPPPAAPTMAAPRVELDAGPQRPPAAGVDGDTRHADAVSPAAPTQQRTPTAPSLPVQPPEGAPPPAGDRRRGLGTRGKAAIGLAAGVVLATSIVITAVIAGNSPAPPTSSTPPSANPTVAPMSLTGKWSGPVSGDQTGFDVVADIVDGAQLNGTVSYPQLNCAGIWTQHGSAGNGIRLITERITQGNCVPAEVTLTPQNDGTLYFTSTYYAASQQRHITVYATMRR